MESGGETPCHVVAMPYPGRGHINSMLNICKILAQNGILVTFVLTEEWVGFIGSDPTPHNLRFRSIPNVIPSERVRASDMNGFFKAVWTKLEDPFEHLLQSDRVGPRPTLLMADTFLGWAVRVGNRRNIPVASFWTMSASMYSFLHHFDLLLRNGHSPINIQERGEERIDYLPGIRPTRVSDFPKKIDGRDPETTQKLVEQFKLVPKAQYLLLPCVYELEPKVVDALAPYFPFPIYTIGPSIPISKSGNNLSSDPEPNYLQWLDHQPCASVLYVSFGSFLSVSRAQMDEMAAGLRASGVRFLWVAGADDSILGEGIGDMGLVVPWCEQLRVLCHCSVGGFLSHCGWNSVQESLYAGVPLLTLPLFGDQYLNSKLIVEDWGIGRRVKECGLSSRDEIVGVVQRFMDLESEEGKETRRRARDVQQMCRGAIAKGGSSETNIKSFITAILEC